MDYCELRFTWMESEKTCIILISAKKKTSPATTNFVSASLGADLENSKSGGRDTCPLASFIDDFYFVENSIKIMQNFKENRV